MRKNIFFIVFIILCAVSCTEKKSNFINTVHLKGQLFDMGSQNVRMRFDGAASMLGDSRDILLKTDAAGYFDTTFVLKEPTYYTISRNTLYLTPGDDMTIKVTQTNTEAEFSGIGAEANNYSRLQECRVHDVRRAVHAYVVDVEQADWHGERRGELLAAGSDDVQLLLGRRRAANPLANHRRCDHRLQAPALAARAQHPRLRVEGDMPDLASGMVLPDHRHIVDQRRGTDATVDLDEQHALVAMPEESLREHGADDVVADGDGESETTFQHASQIKIPPSQHRRFANDTVLDDTSRRYADADDRVGVDVGAQLVDQLHDHVRVDVVIRSERHFHALLWRAQQVGHGSLHQMLLGQVDADDVQTRRVDAQQRAALALAGGVDVETALADQPFVEHAVGDSRYRHARESGLPPEVGAG